MVKIGIIGVGHMGGAIIKGLKKNPNNKIITENPVNPRVDKLAKELDFEVTNTILDFISKNPEIIILTTPAPITLKIAEELKNISKDTIIISAAAGISYSDLKKQLPNNTIIPNTPVAINAGTIGLFLSSDIDQNIQTKIHNFLAQLGDVIAVKESQLSIVGTIGGCGPAFVDVFLDALGDSGVLNGLPRELANELASSMVKGSASLAYKSKLAPSLLRDQVCLG